MSSLFKQAKRDGERIRYWPIRISWGPKLSSCWFTVHGWELPPDRVPEALSSKGSMPGYRRTFGWTFHLGRLKVKFGVMSDREQRRRYAEHQAEHEARMARDREHLNIEYQKTAVERGQRQWRDEAARRRGQQ
jgi:hypothetical protein